MTLEFPAFCTLPNKETDALFHGARRAWLQGLENSTQREMSDVTVNWRRGVSVVTTWRSRKTDTGVGT